MTQATLTMASGQIGDKCALCGQKHPNNKTDDPQSPGWKRESISGLGGRHRSKKETIYPDGVAPPTDYKSAGHHCIALSCFINTKKVDKNLKLNHYLNKAGYNPNNLDNCIDLPSKPKGTIGYVEFEKALIKGKPLQIHIGGHVRSYFSHTRTMTQDLYNFFTDLDQCKEPEPKWLEDLLKAMQALEDEAFQKTAGKDAAFVLHRLPLGEAEDQAIQKGLGPINYPQLNLVG